MHHCAVLTIENGGVLYSSDQDFGRPFRLFGLEMPLRESTLTDCCKSVRQVVLTAPIR